jgi:hypothetical protein
MKTQTNENESMSRRILIASLLVLAVLCLVLVVVSASPQSQTPVPDTAREAAKMPGFASRLAQAQGARKSLPPLPQSGQPGLAFITPSDGDTVSGTNLLIWVAEAELLLAGRDVVYQWSSDGVTWNTIPLQEAPDSSPGSYATTVDTTTLPQGSLYLRASAWPPLSATESPATIQVTVANGSGSLPQDPVLYDNGHYDGTTTFYNDGGIDGNDNGFFISGPNLPNPLGSFQDISNGFVSVASGTPNQLEFGEWVLSGSTPTSISYELGSSAFGADLGFGTVTQNSSNSVFKFTNSFGYGIYDVTIPVTSAAMTAGNTYWVSLSNAANTGSTQSGAWDIPNSGSGGPATCNFRQSGTNYGDCGLGGESFTITGGNSCNPVSLSLYTTGQSTTLKDPRTRALFARGPDKVRLTYNFEVVANLLSGSNPDLCTEFQNASRSGIWIAPDNSFKLDYKWACNNRLLAQCNPNANPKQCGSGTCTRYPFGGELGLGNDGYSKEETGNGLKIHDPTIDWIDDPGSHGEDASTLAWTRAHIESVDSLWEFKSEVDGSLTKAFCHFILHLEWKPKAAQEPTWTLRVLPDSFFCYPNGIPPQ